MFPLEQKNEHWNDPTAPGPVSDSYDPQSHLFQKVFILHLFIFIYCEVKMDRSSVNVAKWKPQCIGASKLLCNNKR